MRSSPLRSRRHMMFDGLRSRWTTSARVGLGERARDRAHDRAARAARAAGRRRGSCRAARPRRTASRGTAGRRAARRPRRSRRRPGWCDARGGARLAGEPPRHHRIGGDLVRRHLDRDRAIEAELAAAIDRAERAAADHGVDRELAVDRLADQARGRVDRRGRRRGRARDRAGQGQGRARRHDAQLGAARGTEPSRLVGRTRTGSCSSRRSARHWNVAACLRLRRCRSGDRAQRRGDRRRQRALDQRERAVGADDERLGRQAEVRRASRPRRGCRAAPTTRGRRSRAR